MTLLLFSFRQRSLVTVHTDLHGHTASGCLCRSRPLQWCSMYLSRLSGCPKTSQRGAPSSGISLLETKSNQQVLNLANTDGGRAQSLFVGPKTAWRLSRCVKECVCVCCKYEQNARYTQSQDWMARRSPEFHQLFKRHCPQQLWSIMKEFISYRVYPLWRQHMKVHSILFCVFKYQPPHPLPISFTTVPFVFSVA